MNVHDRNRIIEVAKHAPKDPTHDFSHFERVHHNTLILMEKEGGDPDIYFAASFLHDMGNL